MSTEPWEICTIHCTASVHNVCKTHFFLRFFYCSPKNIVHYTVFTLPCCTAGKNMIWYSTHMRLHHSTMVKISRVTYSFVAFQRLTLQIHSAQCTQLDFSSHRHGSKKKRMDAWWRRTQTDAKARIKTVHRNYSALLIGFCLLSTARTTSTWTEMAKNNTFTFTFFHFLHPRKCRVIRFLHSGQIYRFSSDILECWYQRSEDKIKKFNFDFKRNDHFI